jgi:hypothetical protein
LGEAVTTRGNEPDLLKRSGDRGGAPAQEVARLLRLDTGDHPRRARVAVVGSLAETEVPGTPEERRVTLVSGGTGLGLEISRRLASPGLYALLGSRDEAKGAAAAGKLAAEGLTVEARQLDVRDQDSVRSLANRV